MSVNRRRLERSSEASSCLEHSLKAGVHLFLLNKFAAFGRCHSFFHGGKKSGFLSRDSEQQRSSPVARGWFRFGGNLRELRLLLWCDVYFHAPQTTGKSRFRQVAGRLGN